MFKTTTKITTQSLASLHRRLASKMERRFSYTLCTFNLLILLVILSILGLINGQNVDKKVDTNVDKVVVGGHREGKGTDFMGRLRPFVHFRSSPPWASSAENFPKIRDLGSGSSEGSSVSFERSVEDEDEIPETPPLPFWSRKKPPGNSARSTGSQTSSGSAILSALTQKKKNSKKPAKKPQKNPQNSQNSTKPVVISTDDALVFDEDIEIQENSTDFPLNFTEIEENQGKNVTKTLVSSKTKSRPKPKVKVTQLRSPATTAQTRVKESPIFPPKSPSQKKKKPQQKEEENESEEYSDESGQSDEYQDQNGPPPGYHPQNGPENPDFDHQNGPENPDFDQNGPENDHFHQEDHEENEENEENEDEEEEEVTPIETAYRIKNKKTKSKTKNSDKKTVTSKPKRKSHPTTAAPKNGEKNGEIENLDDSTAVLAEKNAKKKVTKSKKKKPSAKPKPEEGDSRSAIIISSDAQDLDHGHEGHDEGHHDHGSHESIEYGAYHGPILDTSGQGVLPLWPKELFQRLRHSLPNIPRISFELGAKIRRRDHDGNTHAEDLVDGYDQDPGNYAHLNQKPIPFPAAAVISQDVKYRTGWKHKKNKKHKHQSYKHYKANRHYVHGHSPHPIKDAPGHHGWDKEHEKNQLKYEIYKLKAKKKLAFLQNKIELKRILSLLLQHKIKALEWIA